MCRTIFKNAERWVNLKHILCGTLGLMFVMLVACDDKRYQGNEASEVVDNNDNNTQNPGTTVQPGDDEWAYITQEASELFCETRNMCVRSDSHELMNAMTSTAEDCSEFKLGDFFFYSDEPPEPNASLFLPVVSVDISNVRRSLQDEIDAGLVRLDLEAFDQCMEELRGNCALLNDNVWRWIRWRCPGVFVGQVEDGQQCNHSNECAPNSQCGCIDKPCDSVCDAVCHPRTAVGSPCDQDTLCQNEGNNLGYCDDDEETCQVRPRISPPLQEGELCLQRDSFGNILSVCAPGLFCGPSQDDGEQYCTPHAMAGLGEECRGEQEALCTEGLYCVSPCGSRLNPNACDEPPTCQPLPEIQDDLGGSCGEGQICNIMRGLLCVEGTCYLSGSTGRFAQENEACRTIERQEVFTGLCDEGLVCQSGFCTQAVPQSNGSACRADFMCLSDHCSSGACVPKFQNGEECVQDKQCASQICYPEE